MLAIQLSACADATAWQSVAHLTFAKPFWRSVQTCSVLLRTEAGGTPAFQSFSATRNFFFCRAAAREFFQHVLCVLFLGFFGFFSVLFWVLVVLCGIERIIPRALWYIFAACHLACPNLSQIFSTSLINNFASLVNNFAPLVRNFASLVNNFTFQLRNFTFHPNNFTFHPNNFNLNFSKSLLCSNNYSNKSFSTHPQ
jgi:hypothetical protein